MDIIGQIRTDGPVTAEALIPIAMTSAERTARPDVAGEVVYDSTTGTLWMNDGSVWNELVEATAKNMAYAATQNWDLRANPRATLILTGNATLQTPTNATVGNLYTLLVRASGASRTLTFASTYVEGHSSNTSLSALVIPDGEFRALAFIWDSGRMRLLGT